MKITKEFVKKHLQLMNGTNAGDMLAARIVLSDDFNNHLNSSPCFLGKVYSMMKKWGWVEMNIGYEVLTKKGVKKLTFV